MTSPIVECVPNFSEGRDPQVINQIVDSISGTQCKILDVSADKSHNRFVLTFAGPIWAVEEAAFRVTAEARKLINMENHQGEHPRIGATDVIPFIPIRDVTIEECVDMAARLGERIGRELEIPVYLYAKAARQENRIKLPDVRRGEYEGLKESILSDPNKKPDYGPVRMHPTAGATAVGARLPLIAYNVDLNTSDVKIARAIAKALRESSGGLKHVQAKGIYIDETELAQVTMNLLDYKSTPISLVLRTIQEEAAKRNTGVKSSEIIGLIPLDALLEVASERMKLTGNPKPHILDLINLD